MLGEEVAGEDVFRHRMHICRALAAVSRFFTFLVCLRSSMLRTHPYTLHVIYFLAAILRLLYSRFINFLWVINPAL